MPLDDKADEAVVAVTLNYAFCSEEKKQPLQSSKVNTPKLVSI